MIVCDKNLKTTEFRTPDGGSPTKDGLPIKKTIDIVGPTHMIKTKKSVINCAF